MRKPTIDSMIRKAKQHYVLSGLCAVSVTRTCAQMQLEEFRLGNKGDVFCYKFDGEDFTFTHVDPCLIGFEVVTRPEQFTLSV